MSLPTIYCDPDLSESVPEGGGLLTADPSPAAIAKAIRLVAEDRDRLSRMRDIAAAHPDFPKQSLQTAKIVAIYRDLVDQLPKQNAQTLGR